MKECLWCKEEYEPKREASKFCSTSCRVMWNRKYGKKNQVTPVQIQVLYNSILDVLGKIQYAAPKATYDAPKMANVQDEPLSFDKLNSANNAGNQYHDFAKRLNNADSGEEMQQISLEIEKSGLPWNLRQDLHRLGKKIYQEKFNF